MNSVLCRFCKSSNNETIFEFGKIPNSMQLLSQQNETFLSCHYKIAHCHDCSMIYVPKSFPKEILYSSYFLSANSVAEHQGELIELAVKTLGELNSSGYIVDIGCNDGSFLYDMRKAGVKNDLLGIEPAGNCAELAKQKGINVINDFFSKRVAEEIIAQWGLPKLVVCRHVLEHIEELEDFLEGLSLLLQSEDCFLIFEVPDFGSYSDRGDFSILWEQNFNHFDDEMLRVLFGSLGLTVERAIHKPFSGGSLIAIVRRATVVVSKALPLNIAKLNIKRHEYRDCVFSNIRKVNNTMRLIKKKGGHISAFGPGGRGITFLNLSGCYKYIDFLVDENPDKFGKFLPGSNLPIMSPDALKKENPNYCFTEV